jgi:YesN/AraC family two-component response regulator
MGQAGELMFRAYFVDDEPLVLKEFISNPLFADCGYQVAGSSTDPLTAIKEIKKLLPDVVFCDLNMPYCSGVDMMETLRDNGAACEFVIISAFPDFEESRRFFLLDGFNYLLKPVSDHDLQQLLDKLTARLAGKKAGSRISEDSSSPELNQIISYLKENIAGKHTLESISESHFMNTTHISWLFANNLGTTFVAYLTKIRMEEAARLLKETAKDVREISELCGYHDYFYFCRVFRKHHLCTPSAFREGAACR